MRPPQVPTNAGYHHNIAPLLLAEGNLGGAIHHYRRAFQLNPSDINSKNDLAIVLWRIGKWEAALAALCQVVAINDSHFEGHVNLATVYHKKGQYDLAVLHGRKATQLRPRDPMAHRVLGHILDQMGNPARSLHHRKIAVRRGPGVGGAYHPYDTLTYRKLGAQLVTSGRADGENAHAFMDAYRALCGKHVELANSERTREILHKCMC